MDGHTSNGCRDMTPVSIAISEDDYKCRLWPKLENTLQRMLNFRMGRCPVSFEQIYSCVYKCVCNQLSDRLYCDLKTLIDEYLAQRVFELQEQKEADFIYRFDELSGTFRHASQQISLVFTYLNRFYIEPMLHTTLQKVLSGLFTRNVVDVCIDKLLNTLIAAHTNPFTVPPAVMASVVAELHAWSPEYAKLAPNVFATYIPNILPPMSLEDIPRHITEVRWTQERLTREGYARDRTPLKRPLDTDSSSVDTSL